MPSAAAERKNNIIYVCNDNEAYMNTGFQKSGTTPHGASTSTTPVGSVGRGKVNFKKDVPMMLAMQNAAYVATLCPAYMTDFVAKVQRAAEIKDGLVYLHILNPCPTGWGYHPSKTIELAREGVNSGAWVLMEYEAGKVKLGKRPSKLGQAEAYMKMQKRFRNTSDSLLKQMDAHIMSRYEYLEKLERLGCE